MLINLDSSIVVCKLCNSTVIASQFANHLEEVHNIGYFEYCNLLKKNAIENIQKAEDNEEKITENTEEKNTKTKISRKRKNKS